MRRTICIITLLFLSAGQLQYVLGAPTLKSLTVTIGSTSSTFQILRSDSHLTVYAHDPSDEVSIVLVMESNPGEMVRIFSSLTKPLFMVVGANIIEKHRQHVLIEAKESRVLVQVYGTGPGATEATLLLVQAIDYCPLLVVRVVHGDASDTQPGTDSDPIVSLQNLIQSSNIPEYRKAAYVSSLMESIQMLRDGNRDQATKLAQKALQALEDEGERFDSIAGIIRDTKQRLRESYTILPVDKRIKAENELTLAEAFLRSADYERALDHAELAYELAAPSVIEMVVHYLGMVGPYFIPIAAILIAYFVLIKPILRSQATKGRVSKELP